MADDIDVYEFTRSLSLAGWTALVLVMTATVYVVAKTVELVVTKRCPFCEKRVPKNAIECRFCKKKLV